MRGQICWFHLRLLNTPKQPCRSAQSERACGSKCSSVRNWSRPDFCGYLLGGPLQTECGCSIFDLPPPKRPVKPACLGQLSGDHFVKVGTSNRPDPVGPPRSKGAFQCNVLQHLSSQRCSRRAPDSYRSGKSADWASDRVIALKDEVEFIEPVLAAAEDHLFLVGNSYGAAVALIAALANPGRVQAMA